jgi:hypothetical protein
MSLDGTVFLAYNISMGKIVWPTLEGRLKQPLTSRGEAVAQMKRIGGVTLSPLAEKILEKHMTPNVDGTPHGTWDYESTSPTPRKRNPKKVKLQFMVVPELLATKAYVPNPVRVKIIDPEAIFLTGLLGESGRKLVKAGVEFYFTKSLADKLIEKKIAVKV